MYDVIIIDREIVNVLTIDYNQAIIDTGEQIVNIIEINQTDIAAVIEKEVEVITLGVQVNLGGGSSIVSGSISSYLPSGW